MEYVSHKIIDSLFKKLSENATMSKIEKVSKVPLKNAIQRIIKSIEDPSNSKLINSHLIEPVSVSVSDHMRPYTLAITCTFASIACLLIILIGITAHTNRVVRSRPHIKVKELM